MNLRQLAFSALLLFAVPAYADDGELMQSQSRRFHEFNMQALVRIEPMVEEYRRVKVEAIHEGAKNLLENLREPQTAINSLLVLDITNMFSAACRFAINSTIGLLGTIDVAGEIGLKRDRRDFGAVMGAWGAGTGEKFELPVMGPTNVRDFSGTVVDLLFDPMSYFVITYPLGLALYASERSYNLYDNYDFLVATKTSAVDSYMAFQTMFDQNRYETIRRISLGLGGPVLGSHQKYDFDFDMEQ